MIYKYCLRCGKRLKGEENRIRGFGKICFEKSKKEAEKYTPVIVPLSNYPIEIISESEIDKNLQGSAGAKAKSKESSEHQQSNARQSQARNLQSKKQSKREDPPHLEETLTPTYKKAVLFTPHTATPSPDKIS